MKTKIQLICYEMLEKIVNKNGNSGWSRHSGKNDDPNLHVEIK